MQHSLDHARHNFSRNSQGSSHPFAGRLDDRAMNVFDLDKHRLWDGKAVDRLILPRINNTNTSPRTSPRPSPKLTRRNTSYDVIMRGPHNHDVTLKVPGFPRPNSPESNLVMGSSTRGIQEEARTEVTLEVPSLMNGGGPDVTYGSSSGSGYPMEEPYDSDDDLRVSMTLPRYSDLSRLHSVSKSQRPT